MHQGIIDILARRISDHLRCLTLVITMATIMDPGTITNSHIPSAATLTFCSLQVSISILANNNNTYTLHRYRPQQLLINSHMVLAYFRPPARLLIPTFQSRHPTAIEYLVWAISVELLRVHDPIAERNCGVVWGRRERLQLLGG